MEIENPLLKYAEEYKRKQADLENGQNEIDIPPENCTEEYNRKTIDYGNGKMEVVVYRNEKYKRVNIDLESSGQKKPPKLTDEAQEERTRQQIYSIRRKIKGYALINDFSWFVTLTFNPDKINSHDFSLVKKELLKWCRKMRDKYGKFDYLLVPELHKSGAVHFHGLLGNVAANFKEAINPKTEKPVIRHDRQVYNLLDWEFGFSDCEEIESHEKAASYITKYVTTALLTDKNMYKQKRYYNSQGLKKPTITFDLADNTELEKFTPNFGIVSTDIDGNNVIDIGIYKLDTDEKTGELVQKDDGYLIKAKNQSL